MRFKLNLNRPTSIANEISANDAGMELTTSPHAPAYNQDYQNYVERETLRYYQKRCDFTNTDNEELIKTNI